MNPKSCSDSCLNPCELTATLTALANIVAPKLTDEELLILQSSLLQLNNTLNTFRLQRAYCKNPDFIPWDEQEDEEGELEEEGEGD